MSSLSAVGATQEAKFYADLFSKEDPERFALILLDPRVLKNPLLEALTSNLQILSSLGLAPTLVIGALDDDRTAIRFQAQRLQRDLDSSGVKVAKLDTATYGLLSDIRRRAQAGIISILEMTQQSGADGLTKLINDLRPVKIVSLQPSGGLDLDGLRRRNLRLREIDVIAERPEITPGQRLFLRTVQRIEQDANEGRRAYVLASPLNLLSELFTTKGSGTLIRRGAAISRQDSLEGLDKDAMIQAINRAFRRKIDPTYLEQPIECAFFEPDFRAGAIFTRLGGHPYLSKFWVVPEAQGEGLARDLWERIAEDIPTFFWRSRTLNPFNDWYVQACDGMQLSGDWRVFWKGLDAADLPDAIKAAAAAADDFKTDDTEIE